MFNRHVTHLLTRYVNGTLRPRLGVRVVNHVRTCDSCRSALAREERIHRDIQRELPQTGSPRAAQLAGVWADVMSEINAPHKRIHFDSPALLSGVSVLVAVALVMLLALPLMAENGVRVEAAPQQARPVNTAFPTPGVTETDEAAVVPLENGSAVLPQATIAFVSDDGAQFVSTQSVGATPAPVPQVTVSPEAVQGGARW